MSLVSTSVPSHAALEKKCHTEMGEAVDLLLHATDTLTYAENCSKLIHAKPVRYDTNTKDRSYPISLVRNIFSFVGSWRRNTA